MLEKYKTQDVEAAVTPEILDTAALYGERMVNALQRGRKKSIVPPEAIDEFTKAVRYLGFQRATIPEVKR